MALGIICLSESESVNPLEESQDDRMQEDSPSNMEGDEIEVDILEFIAF